MCLSGVLLLFCLFKVASFAQCTKRVQVSAGIDLHQNHAGGLFELSSLLAVILPMELIIKNMVCARCKWVVKKVLEEQGLTPRSVELGKVDIVETLQPAQVVQLSNMLQEYGFELLEDRQSKLVSQIKTSVLEYAGQSEGEQHQNLSDFLVGRLHQDYSALSHLFSSVEGTTIEQYHIAQRIERAKELLVYNELTLSEIAWKLGYSSAAHLSAQFKKVTGLTPTHFKEIGPRKRRGLEEV